VDVSSFSTVIAAEVSELPLCVESPGYVPDTMKVPEATPVMFTMQPPEASRVQLASTTPMAAFDATKLTVPIGVLARVVVSVTVAVQVEVPLTKTWLGLQAMLVDVLSFGVTVTVAVRELPL